MWILPSRNRPHNLKRFFEKYHITQASSPGVVCIRDDDPSRPEYEALELPYNWKLVAYPPMSMVERTNQVFYDYPNEDWYGYVDDDAVPETYKWDVKLIEAAGRDGISHPFNGIGNEKLASQFVMGGDLARDLGWILLKGLKRLYGDNAVTDVGRSRKCIKYLPDVKLVQYHFSNGLAPVDTTYQKPEAKDDHSTYMKWYSENIQVPVTFICLKAGTVYGPEYVNILRDMISRNLAEGTQGRFVCITDDPTGLDEGIEVFPLPDDLETWWGKLYMFKRGLFPDGTRCLFMDLDTLFVGPLDEIIKYDGEFATLRDFYYPKQLGPAIIAWKAGDFASAIWEEWVAKGKPRHAMGDLWWLNNLNQGRFSKEIDILQDLYPGKFVSYKVSCNPYPPKGTSIVCFHGQPKPDNCGQSWVAGVWKVGGNTASELESVANTSFETVKANVLSACDRDLPWLELKPIHEKHAVIVGGGPSLERTIDEVKWRHSIGQTIIAINGTAEYLNTHGIRPDIQVIIDAREHNKRFVNPWWSKERYLASQCDPAVFEASGGNTTVFHMNTAGIESILPENKVAHLISSGTTVGLAAMAIAYTQGYRTIHLHGFDSSYSENHHAYSQPENDNDQTVDVSVEGKTFKCAAWMATQAQQFQELALQLAQEGVIITVAGDGLIPYIAHCMSKGD